jgi:hypothetical protein
MRDARETWGRNVAEEGEKAMRPRRMEREGWGEEGDGKQWSLPCELPIVPLFLTSTSSVLVWPSSSREQAKSKAPGAPCEVGWALGDNQKH